MKVSLNTLYACAILSSCNALAESNNKVVLIGLDGVQYEQLLTASTPNIDKLNILSGFTGGELGGISEQITSSGPSWTTILTGTWANKHQIKNNSARFANPQHPSIFKVLSNAERSSSAMLGWANPMRDYLTYDQPLLDYLYYPDVKNNNLEDYRVMDEKLSYMFTRTLKKFNSDFTFVHLDHVDDVGHQLGFGPKYSQGITKLDDYVGRIITATKKNKDQNWLILLVTDHGRSNKNGGKSHGEQTAQERTIWIAANRDIKIPLNSLYGQVSLVDIAPTIYDFLAIESKGLDLDGQSLLVK